ncbi:MAG: polysaccharide ABC transporter ATP-binding protein [Stellaceae bacterium]
MAEVVIRAEGLGKKYLIGHAAEREGYVALRDVLARGGRSLWRKTADMVRGRALVGGDAVEEFWALKDVSFEVRRGEVLGIIGRNGAGKSTLLKILSRITEPTEGRVSINGRVASLLEVGTGFHPELTGRENIYLNGAILGMTRAEIRKKFDEIVAFAEIDKFLDTPVKRYSSGMYVRLAFAVAAHLDPEILIVDEVLAVGDAEFQKKCLGKMDEVSRGQGRTVLLVSHNLASIATLTDRSLLMASGHVLVDGSVAETLSRYLSRGPGKTTYARSIDAQTDAHHISRIELGTSDPEGVHRFGEPLQIKFWIKRPRPWIKGCFCFQIFNQLQVAVIHSSYHHWLETTTRSTLLVCSFPRLLLNVGRFYLRTWLQDGLYGGEVHEMLDGICAFEVVCIDQTQFAGWRPESCVYREQHRWSVIDAALSGDGFQHASESSLR